MSNGQTKKAGTLSPAPELIWIEKVTRVMDEAFRIPGTNFRFGLDPLLGLIPGMGDLTASLISGVILLSMVRYGVSGRVVVIMVGNFLLDLLIGSIPIVGDIFDGFFKVNKRNLQLLREHLEEGKHSGSGRVIILKYFLVLLLLAGIFVYGLWRIIVILLNLKS